MQTNRIKSTNYNIGERFIKPTKTIDTYAIVFKIINTAFKGPSKWIIATGK